jgi:hypothetical protein
LNQTTHHSTFGIGLPLALQLNNELCATEVVRDPSFEMIFGGVRIVTSKVYKKKLKEKK